MEYHVFQVKLSLFVLIGLSVLSVLILFAALSSVSVTGVDQKQRYKL